MFTVKDIIQAYEKFAKNLFQPVEEAVNKAIMIWVFG